MLKFFVQKYCARYNILFLACLVPFCFFIAISGSRIITDANIRSDAAHNTLMAYNFFKHGILSMDSGDKSDINPTNYREPLVPFISSIFLYLHPGVDKSIAYNNFLSGKYARYIKQVNIVWFFFLLLGVGILGFVVTESKLISFLSVFCGIYPVFGYFPSLEINTLLSELPASVLMIWASIFFIKSFSNQNLGWVVFSGLFLGLLTLVKASFMYIFFAIFCFYVLFFIKNCADSRRSLISIVLLSSSFFLVISPYMIRNKFHFDTFQITQRSGLILSLRAEMNLMELQEIRAFFYWHGPTFFKFLVNGSAFGFEHSNFSKGGKFERLNDDLDLSFYKQARSEWLAARQLFWDKGHENTIAADAFLKRKGLLMILENPWRHAAMTIPFLWRGMWCFSSYLPVYSPDQYYRFIPFEILNMLSYISLFAIFVFSVIKMKIKLFMFSVIPVSMLVFNAFFTQNLPRFSGPAVPFMLLSFLLLISYIVLFFRKRLISSAESQ